MPIYEETYRAWHGQLAARPRTWWIIARTGSRLRWKRAMILVLLLAALPFLVRGAQIYVAMRLGDSPELAEMVQELQIDAGFFADFLRGQAFFLVLVLILAGAGLIASDRKFGALAVYFSKPVRFWDYVLGKFLIVAFYGSLITLLPCLLLFLMRVLLAQDAAFLQEYYWIPFSIIGQVALSLLTLGGVILVLSSTTGGSRSAAVLFFAVLTVPDLLRQILPSISGLGLVSLPAVLRQTSALLFGLERPFDFSAWLGLGVLMGVAGLSLAVLKIRVRPTEVVR